MDIRLCDVAYGSDCLLNFLRWILLYGRIKYEELVADSSVIRSYVAVNQRRYEEIYSVIITICESLNLVDRESPATLLRDLSLVDCLRRFSRDNPAHPEQIIHAMEKILERCPVVSNRALLGHLLSSFVMHTYTTSPEHFPILTKTAEIALRSRIKPAPFSVSRLTCDHYASQLTDFACPTLRSEVSLHPELPILTGPLATGNVDIARLLMIKAGFEFLDERLPRKVLASKMELIGHPTTHCVALSIQGGHYTGSDCLFLIEYVLSLDPELCAPWQPEQRLEQDMFIRQCCAFCKQLEDPAGSSTQHTDPDRAARNLGRQLGTLELMITQAPHLVESWTMVGIYVVWIMASHHMLLGGPARLSINYPRLSRAHTKKSEDEDFDEELFHNIAADLP